MEIKFTQENSCKETTTQLWPQEVAITTLLNTYTFSDTLTNELYQSTQRITSHFNQFSLWIKDTKSKMKDAFAFHKFKTDLKPYISCDIQNLENHFTFINFRTIPLKKEIDVQLPLEEYLETKKRYANKRRKRLSHDIDDLYASRKPKIIISKKKSIGKPLEGDMKNIKQHDQSEVEVFCSGESNKETIKPEEGHLQSQGSYHTESSENVNLRSKSKNEDHCTATSKDRISNLTPQKDVFDMDVIVEQPSKEEDNLKISLLNLPNDETKIEDKENQNQQLQFQNEEPKEKKKETGGINNNSNTIGSLTSIINNLRESDFKLSETKINKEHSNQVFSEPINQIKNDNFSEVIPHFENKNQSNELGAVSSILNSLNLNKIECASQTQINSNPSSTEDIKKNNLANNHNNLATPSHNTFSVNSAFTFKKEKQAANTNTNTNANANVNQSQNNLLQSKIPLDKNGIYDLIFNNNQSYSKTDQSPSVIEKWNPNKIESSNKGKEAQNSGDQIKNLIIYHNNPYALSQKYSKENVTGIKNSIQSTLTKNVIDPEYEITENSESSADEKKLPKKIETPSFHLIKKKKSIPKWANNKKYIEDRVSYQISNLDYQKIFGICKIDHLNLNVIFSTEKSKYDIRGDSADWRLDNTLSSAHGDNCKVDNPAEVNTKNQIFPGTSRQLLGTFNKEIIPISSNKKTIKK